MPATTTSDAIQPGKKTKPRTPKKRKRQKNGKKPSVSSQRKRQSKDVKNGVLPSGKKQHRKTKKPSAKKPTPQVEPLRVVKKRSRRRKRRSPATPTMDKLYVSSGHVPVALRTITKDYTRWISALVRAISETDPISQSGPLAFLCKDPTKFKMLCDNVLNGEEDKMPRTHLLDYSHHKMVECSNVQSAGADAREEIRWLHEIAAIRLYTLCWLTTAFSKKRTTRVEHVDRAREMMMNMHCGENIPLIPSKKKTKKLEQQEEEIEEEIEEDDEPTWEDDQ